MTGRCLTTADLATIVSAMSTRQTVRDMYRAGRSVREIAAALGISTQAVYQHLARLRRDGELPDDRAEAS